MAKTSINIKGQIVDGSTKTPDRKFRDAWVYDGNVVSIDPTGKTLIMTGLVKEECGRRIFEVASANTQMNLAAAAATDLLSTGELAAFKASLGWVAQMRANVVTLVAAGDEDYAKDSKWPKLPSGVQDLADKY